MTKSHAVLRGGLWSDKLHVRVARSFSDGRNNRYAYLGIRLVEVVGKPRRVFRGSCSGSELKFARVTNGNFVGPGFRSETIGVRLVEVTEDLNPVAAASGSYRVYRGGGWIYVPQFARVASRDGDAPGDRRSSLGIRLVEVVENEEEGSK